MRNCFIHELELENDRGAVETSSLFLFACFYNKMFISLFINLSCFLGRGGGYVNKEQYSSNCNRPLYSAGVINASVAIIPYRLIVTFL